MAKTVEEIIDVECLGSSDKETQKAEILRFSADLISQKKNSFFLVLSKIFLKIF